VITITLAELTALLEGRVVVEGPQQPSDDPLRQVMTDSRVPSHEPAIFFALATDRADGHDHVAAAALAGARVAVVDRVIADGGVTQVVVDDVWSAIARLGRHVVDTAACRVVAITGSYGKTTVKDLSAAALSTGRRVVASRGSFNNELGVPLTMLAVESTTDVLVAEAGARSAGDMALLGQLLLPDVSVVTAVGPVHLETFGDEAGVAAEKSRLVAALRPGGTAVLNADDVRVAAMAQLAPAAVMVSPSGRRSDVRARDVVTDEEGRIRAVADTPWGSTEVSLPLPGAHHLTNALLALAVAGIEGVAIADAAAAIAGAPTSPSRSALHHVGGVTVLDDAYNASPPTVEGALATLASLPCDGRRWAVLGVMAELGPTSREQHLTIGRVCAAVVDELIVVGEAAQGIAEGALQMGGGLRVRSVADHVEAAALVAAEVGRGDAVLFKASRVATLDRAAASVIAALAGADAA
jgi:UDP-N-acetylmuramoyl-tripeptide--D-alanyl-D-alanine ligase